MNTQLTNIEKQMFSEIFKVLKKYKGTTREFGLQLSHSHFDLNKGEVLHEIHDKVNRVITITPTPKNKIPASSITTSWNFSRTGKPIINLMCCDN